MHVHGEPIRIYFYINYRMFYIGVLVLDILFNSAFKLSKLLFGNLVLRYIATDTDIPTDI